MWHYITSKGSVCIWRKIWFKRYNGKSASSTLKGNNWEKRRVADDFLQ